MTTSAKSHQYLIAPLFIEALNYSIARIAGGREQLFVSYFVSVVLAVWISARLYYSCRYSRVVSAAMAGFIAIVDFVLGIVFLVVADLTQFKATTDAQFALVGHALYSGLLFLVTLSVGMAALFISDLAKSLINRVRTSK